MLEDGYKKMLRSAKHTQCAIAHVLDGNEITFRFKV